jgi:CHAT domain-containing protein/tetratricopeptide (TPR) repeat protein
MIYLTINLLKAHHQLRLLPWLVIFLGMLLTPVWGLAQCTGSQKIYQQLTALSAGSTGPLLINNLKTLEKQCIRCGQTNDSVYAKLLHTFGKTYLDLGKYDSVLFFSRKSIAVNNNGTALSKRANTANSYFNMGRAFIELHRKDEAIAAYARCIHIAVQYPEKYRVGANAWAQQASLYYLSGDYEKVIQCAEQGYQLAVRAGNTTWQVHNLVQKAQALVNLGQLQLAETTLQEALGLVSQTNDPAQIAPVYSIIADFQRDSKHETKAIRYYERALLASQQAGNAYGCAQAVASLGRISQLIQHDYQQARRFYQQALSYNGNDLFAKAAIIGSIGSTYKDQKNYSQAIQYYQQALITAPIGFANRQPTNNPALQLVRKSSSKGYLLTILLGKADIWLDYAKPTNNPAYLKNALATYQLADQLIDFMRWEHTGQQSKLFWREQTRRMYERAIETCYRLKDTTNAFRFFEKSRAVMLADKLNELGARQQLPPAQAAQEQTLRQRLTTLQSQLADTKTRPDSLQTALSTAQDKLDRFLKQLETSNPTYYRYKYDNTVPTLPDVQQWLGQEKASLVSYFVGDSVLYVLGITPTGAKLIQRPVAQYRQETAAFRQLLADANAQNRNFGQYKTLAHSLYQQLLAPLGLPDGRVVVSPDGFFLPLDALSRRADQPDFLVNHYAFSYTYSARLLLKDPNRTASWSFPGSQRAFLGMAPITFPAGLATLPGSDDALTQIGKGFAWPTLLTGPTATRRAFLSQSPGHRVIQLFTHADADTSRKAASEEPVLFFADSSLRLSDLNNQQPFGAELLVLSACRTGLGANQQGEGVFSLARGFASLGIPSIGTTLWSVENQATYRLTELFYEFLQQGLPKDVALQRAKQQFITEDDAANQLPARWAGLILVGDAAPLSQGVAWWVWMLVGGSLLAGVGVWIWRKGTRE